MHAAVFAASRYRNRTARASWTAWPPPTGGALKSNREALTVCGTYRSRCLMRRSPNAASQHGHDRFAVADLSYGGYARDSPRLVSHTL
jgi:hypothetical protein